MKGNRIPRDHKETDKRYDIRKLEVLNYVAGAGRGITPTDIRYAFRIEPNLARFLLFHYRKQRLLNRRKRGVYTISARGKKRLEYLKLRQDISSVVCDIGLNHHKALPKPFWEIAKIYKEKTGMTIPSGFF